MTVEVVGVVIDLPTVANPAASIDLNFIAAIYFAFGRMFVLSTQLLSMWCCSHGYRNKTKRYQWHAGWLCVECGLRGMVTDADIDLSTHQHYSVKDTHDLSIANDLFEATVATFVQLACLLDPYTYLTTNATLRYTHSKLSIALEALNALVRQTAAASYSTYTALPRNLRAASTSGLPPISAYG